jgi:hypothetical protein
MIAKAFIAATLLLAFNTAGAVRVVEQVERAVELTLGDLILPSAGGSTISFRQCATCSINTHQLTDSTEFKANGQTVQLVDFLRIADEIASKPNGKNTAVAAVFLDINTGRLTRVALRE